MRTWHGWAKAETEAKRVRKRRKRKQFMRQNFIWRSTAADYSWVFWDANGDKQRQFESKRAKSGLRYLPHWLKSSEHGSLHPDAKSTLKRIGAAEEGKILPSSVHASEEPPSVLLYTHLKSKSRLFSKQALSGTISDSDYLNDGSLFCPSEDTATLVKWRKGPRAKSRSMYNPFQRRSETKRTRYLNHKRLKEPTGNLNPSLEERTSVSPVRNSLPNNHSEGLRSVNRVLSFPMFTTLHNTYILKRRASLPCPPKSQIQLLTEPEPYPVRDPADPGAPNKSVNMLVSECTATRYPYMKDSLAFTRQSSDESFVQDLSRRLDAWTKAANLEPFVSIGNEYDGTSGRPASPAISWDANREPRTFYNSDESREGKTGLYGKMPSFQADSQLSMPCPRLMRSAKHLRSPEVWAVTTQTPTIGSRTKSADGKAINSYRTIVLSILDDFFSGSSLANFLSLKVSAQYQERSKIHQQKWASLPSRTIRKFAPDNFTDEVLSSPVKCLWAWNQNSLSKSPRPRSTSYEMKPILAKCPPLLTPQASDLAKPSINPKALGLPHLRKEKEFTTWPPKFQSPPQKPLPSSPLSVPEQTFLEAIDQRLQRLQYELSPGFRGPRGGESDPKWWFETVPYAGSIAVPANAPHDNNTPRPSTPRNIPLTPRHSSASSVMSGPEHAGCSRDDHASALQKLFVAPSTTDVEPDGNAIDTAAWVLRRPPMGLQPSRIVEEGLLYTSGRGPAKTLVEWQQGKAWRRSWWRSWRHPWRPGRSGNHAGSVLKER